jgi:hypothetical protein
MTAEEKILINKQIRAYQGQNTFIDSLKLALRGNRLKKTTIGNRSFKILSDRQYEVARQIMDSSKPIS